MRDLGMKRFRYLSTSISTSLAAGTCIVAGKVEYSPPHGLAHNRHPMEDREKDEMMVGAF